MLRATGRVDGDGGCATVAPGAVGPYRLPAASGRTWPERVRGGPTGGRGTVGVHRRAARTAERGTVVAVVLVALLLGLGVGAAGAAPYPSPAGGTRDVSGPVLDRYLALGGPTGPLGVVPPGTRVVTVVAPSPGSTTATPTAWQRGDRGWTPVVGPVTARVGAGGIGAASESSTRTPAGTFGLTDAFGRAGNPGTALPCRVVDRNDWWVSDVDSGRYTPRPAARRAAATSTSGRGRTCSLPARSTTTRS